MPGFNQISENYDPNGTPENGQQVYFEPIPKESVQDSGYTLIPKEPVDNGYVEYPIEKIATDKPRYIPEN